MLPLLCFGFDADELLYQVQILRCAHVRYDYAFDAHVPTIRLFRSRLEPKSPSNVATCRRTVMEAVECLQMTLFRISQKCRSRGSLTPASHMHLDFHGHILQDQLTIRLKGAVHHQPRLRKRLVQHWHRFLDLPVVQIDVYRCSPAQAPAARCLQCPLRRYLRKYNRSPFHHHFPPLMLRARLLSCPPTKLLPPNNPATCCAERPRQ